MLQADELGVLLAHGACFDVRGGISVFHKIAALQAAGAGDGSGQRTGWTDTHPASEERFVALRALGGLISAGGLFFLSQALT